MEKKISKIQEFVSKLEKNQTIKNELFLLYSGGNAKAEAKNKNNHKCCNKVEKQD